MSNSAKLINISPRLLNTLLSNKWLILSVLVLGHIINDQHPHSRLYIKSLVNVYKLMIRWDKIVKCIGTWNHSTYENISIHTCVYTIYIHIYIYVSMCIYIYIHIYTYKYDQVCMLWVTTVHFIGNLLQFPNHSHTQLMACELADCTWPPTEATHSRLATLHDHWICILCQAHHDHRKHMGEHLVYIIHINNIHTCT